MLQKQPKFCRFVNKLYVTVHNLGYILGWIISTLAERLNKHSRKVKQRLNSLFSPSYQVPQAFEFTLKVSILHNKSLKNKKFQDRSGAFILDIVLKYLLRSLNFWIWVLLKNYWLKINLQFLNNIIRKNRIVKAKMSNKWCPRFTVFRRLIRLSKYRIGLFWHLTGTFTKLQCLQNNSVKEGVRTE